MSANVVVVVEAAEAAASAGASAGASAAAGAFGTELAAVVPVVEVSCLFTVAHIWRARATSPSAISDLHNHAIAVCASLIPARPPSPQPAGGAAVVAMALLVQRWSRGNASPAMLRRTRAHANMRMAASATRATAEEEEEDEEEEEEEGEGRKEVLESTAVASKVESTIIAFSQASLKALVAKLAPARSRRADKSPGSTVSTCLHTRNALKDAVAVVGAWDLVGKNDDDVVSVPCSMRRLAARPRNRRGRPGARPTDCAAKAAR